MRRVIVVLILLIPISQLLQGQEIEWQRSFGGSGWDLAFSISPTSDGGYVLAGESMSNISGNKTEDCHGGIDFWIIRLDQNGNIVWQNTIGANGDERFPVVRQTPDGGFIVGGSSNSGPNGDKTIGNYDLTYLTSDYWILKLNGSGDILWQQVYGGTGNETLYSLEITSDGGIIIGGRSNSPPSGDKTEAGMGYDYWIVKADSLGNIEWQNTIVGDQTDELRSISQTDDGGYICGGVSNSSIGGDKTEMSNGLEDLWILKLDAFGNIVWQNTIGGSNNDLLTKIFQTHDGGYICGVYSNSGVSGDKIVPRYDTTTFDHDVWILKLDSTGNIEWQTALGGSSYDFIGGITESPDSNIYLGMSSRSHISGVKTESPVGLVASYDYWIVKLGPTGYIIWQNSIGGDEIDVIDDAILDSNGNFLVFGTSNSDQSGDKTSDSFGSNDLWLIKITESFYSMTGTLFADFNTNGVLDTGEPAIPFQKITEVNSNRVAFTGPSGFYNWAVPDTGSYEVYADYINYFISSPLTHSANLNAINQTDSLNDFAFHTTGSFNDLCLILTPFPFFRSGFNASYTLNYKNVGTTIISNAYIVFYPDNNITYTSSNVTPTTITPDSIIWNVGSVSPFQTGNIVVNVNVNIGLPIGTFINSGATIYPITGDANPSCNTKFWEVLTVGSYDPNDILVDRDTLYDYEFPNPPYLDYTIRFQNTGNDTAFTVKILNPIDTNNLQLNTLEFVAASHPMDMRYIYYERNMEFQFDNILLPDSNINEPLSHGFIRYRIKPKSTLSAGDSIRNNAHIYFDFNNPIATNTAITEVVLPTGIAAAVAAAAAVEVYPNPSSGDVTVSFMLKQNAEVEIILINAMGQIVTTTHGKFLSGKNEINISASDLSSGIYFIKISMDGNVAVKKIIKM